jgi:hypothetical protein
VDGAVAGAVPHLRNAAGGQVSAGAMGDRKGNLRTALILVSIVLVFFIGIMVKTALFGQ